MTAPLAVLRADASPMIGGGHVMRMLALAEPLRTAGWQVRLATHVGTDVIVPAARAVEHIWLDLAAVEDEPERLANALPGGCDLLVVDSYRWARAQETACRRFARRIAVVDDFAAGAHEADLVLDPTPGRDARAYAGLMPAGATVLAGAAWAPLRPAIQALRATALPGRRDRRPKRILVALGMTDSANATAQVLDGLAGLRFDGAIDVVLGAAAPHRDSVARSMPGNAMLHLDPPDLPALMAAADLAIGAGGVSALERACLGLPSLLVEVADNQRAAIEGLVAAGAAWSLGTLAALTPAAIAAAAAMLIEDDAARTRLSVAAALLCDGLGAARASTWLAPVVARDGLPVSLRPVTAGDAAFTLAWQRSPGVRAFARNPAIPTAAEHAAWLERKLADPACIFSIVLHGGSPAGVLRLDAAGANGRYEISILVDPARQGLGIGRAALTLARRLAPEAILDAEVLPGNDASVAMFTAAGFRPAPNGFVSVPDRRA